MNILMTGGTGLIGKAFIKQFPDNQYTVLTRNPQQAGNSLPSAIRLITSLDDLSDLNEFDAVINLAGEPIIDKRWSAKQKAVICQSRWQTTEQLVALFGRSDNPPEVFLSGSAIGIYGDRGATRLTESATLAESDFPSEICRQWEQIAARAEACTRVVTLRTGIVLAPKQGALGKMLLPFKLGLGGRIGAGQQYMSWIHYRDHIRAMAYLLTNPNIRGPVNLTAPNPQPNAEFSRTLARVLHRPAVLPMPQSALKLGLGESACLLLDSQRVIPEKLVNSGFVFEFPDLYGALSDLA